MLSLKELTVQSIVTDKSLFSQTGYKGQNNIKIPFRIADKLLKGLDDVDCGINECYLEFFNKYTTLKSINIHGNRIKSLTNLQFLNNSHLETISIEQMRHFKVNTWIREVNGSNLERLCLRYCIFKTKEKIFTLSSFKFKNIWKPLRNLKSLDVSSTNFDNFHFKIVTKELRQLVELNISKTNVDNIESVKYLSNLSYFDVSNVSKSCILSTYSSIDELKSLVYLDVSQYTIDNTSSNNLREFLINVEWPDMRHLNISGHWKVDFEVIR